MTNLHKIRARIRSVNSTQQITRTMKMIAVSKLRKTQTSLAGVRLFADKSQAVLNALLAGDASFEHPYLTPRRHVGRVCYVVFWGNRGLCGAYNQLLLRHLEGLVRAEARPCSVIVCGRWGRDVLAGTDLPVRQIFSDLSDTPTMAEALEIAEELKNLYRTGEADEIPDRLPERPKDTHTPFLCECSERSSTVEVEKGPDHGPLYRRTCRVHGRRYGGPSLWRGASATRFVYRSFEVRWRKWNCLSWTGST